MRDRAERAVAGPVGFARRGRLPRGTAASSSPDGTSHRYTLPPSVGRDSGKGGEDFVTKW